MNEVDDFFRRAYELQRAGRLEEAVEYYKKSIALAPTAEAHTFLGWTYSFMNRYDEAIAECHRAIAVDPSFGNPYNDIGAYLIELGRLEEAIPWLEKAIEAPRYEPRQFPHVNLARVYERLHAYDQAIRHLRQALEHEPGHPFARRKIAELQARLN
jgi:tetratricopeptide (TPR) repeat protein